MVGLGASESAQSDDTDPVTADKGVKAFVNTNSCYPDGTVIRLHDLTPKLENPLHLFTAQNATPTEFIQAAVKHVAGNGPSVRLNGLMLSDYFRENPNDFYALLASSLKEVVLTSEVGDTVRVSFNRPGLEFKLKKPVNHWPDASFSILPEQNNLGLILCNNPDYFEEGGVPYTAIKTLEGGLRLNPSFNASFLSALSGKDIPPIEDAEYLIIVGDYLVYLDKAGSRLCTPSTVELESMEWEKFEEKYGDEYNHCLDAIMDDINSSM